MTIALFSLLCLEVTIRIIVLNPLNYFKKIWNLFDFIIVIISSVSLSLIFHSPDSKKYAILFLNFLNILRILRVIKKINILKKLTNTLKIIIPQIANIFVLLCTIFFIYGSIGVDLFAYLKPQKNVGKYNIHFRSVFKAIINLLRCCTGESGFLQLHDCGRTQEPNFICHEIEDYYGFEKYGNNIYNISI